MRWTDGAPVKGQTRTRSQFLTRSMQIGSEVRWLENAEWIEEFGYESQIRIRGEIEEMEKRGEVDIPAMSPDPISRRGPQWIPLRWLN